MRSSECGIRSYVTNALWRDSHSALTSEFKLRRTAGKSVCRFIMAGNILAAHGGLDFGGRLCLFGQQLMDQIFQLGDFVGIGEVESAAHMPGAVKGNRVSVMALFRGWHKENVVANAFDVVHVAG